MLQLLEDGRCKSVRSPEPHPLVGHGDAHSGPTGRGEDGFGDPVLIDSSHAPQMEQKGNIMQGGCVGGPALPALPTPVQLVARLPRSKRKAEGGARRQ